MLDPALFKLNNSTDGCETHIDQLNPVYSLEIKQISVSLCLKIYDGSGLSVNCKAKWKRIVSTSILKGSQVLGGNLEISI